jgi:hypothetical protein
LRAYFLSQGLTARARASLTGTLAPSVWSPDPHAFTCAIAATCSHSNSELASCLQSHCTSRFVDRVLVLVYCLPQLALIPDRPSYRYNCKCAGVLYDISIVLCLMWGVHVFHARLSSVHLYYLSRNLGVSWVFRLGVRRVWGVMGRRVIG